ncbi:MAG: methyltransferase [Acutalibacteraceae bacterium]|nr:methyltransferase [Clostridia bacterium]MEE1330479.1 methyltransferase [Acutalibacteraceae bacterium]
MDTGVTKKEPLGRDFFINVSSHHTFGTDAVVLADFAKAKKKDTLVDLGTGCGIIPFLMLRDGNLRSAVGVDISEEAAELAKRTGCELKLDNFTVINSDLKDLKGKIDFGCHTLVTCNPPYKAPNGGLKNTEIACAVARHEIACTLEDIIAVSARLLETSGRLCMCHRPERLAELFTLMHKYKLEPKRMRLVCQRPGKEPWLVLLEGRKCAKTGIRIEPTLYVYENDGFSPEMIRIYGPYKEAYL